MWDENEDKLLDENIEKELKENSLQSLVPFLDKVRIKRRAKEIIISGRIKRLIHNNIVKYEEILRILEIPNDQGLINGKELIDLLLDDNKFAILSSKLKNKIFW